MSPDEIKTLKDGFSLHHKVLFGDPERLNEMPGVIAEQSSMKIEQRRTNEILMEVRNALIWIVGIVLSGVILAVLALIFKQPTT
jgi:hypothetical protein